MEKTAFWQTKTLQEMDSKEWESLCDGCARCCLIKLEDADDGGIYYTQVACQYLQQDSCRCSHYENRQEKVPTCLWLTPDNVAELNWLPDTCAYRLIDEGQPLPDWHPLVSGDPQSVHRAGISVKDKVFSESNVHNDELEEHIIHWVRT